MTGPSWVDAALGRDEGMARAEEYADVGWSDVAFDLIVSYGETHEFFHVDEWWRWALNRGLWIPRNGRALGPVIMRARRTGLLVRTHSSAPSVRSHLSDKPIWRCTDFNGDRTGEFRGFAVA